MPLFLLNHFSKQELVDLPNDRHIQGEILWSEEKHGPLPDGIIVGAMDLNLVEEEYNDPSGAVDWVPDLDAPPPEAVPVEEGKTPPILSPVLKPVPRKLKREISRSLVLNADKKAQLDNEQAERDAEKIQKENKKKAKDNLVFKLKNEDLKIHEVNELLRELF